MKKSLLSKILLFCLTIVALTGCNKGKDGPGNPSGPTDPVQPVDPIDPVEPVDTTYSFTFIGTNCSVSEYSSQYKLNDEVSITITPNNGYEFDTNMIKVTGVDNYEFSIETGVLTVIMTNNVTVTCTCKDINLFYFTFQLEHMSVNQTTGYRLNAPVVLQFTPEDGYELPEKDGFQITNGIIETYEKEKGYMLVTVRGNITISASGIHVPCEVTTDVANATVTGLKNSYFKCELLTGKLIPNKQYALPQSITVEGDSTIKSYDSSSGKFEILLGTTCVIHATAVYSPVAVTVTTNLTNCSLSKSKSYNVYDSYCETITAHNNYLLPKVLSKVEGLKDYTYNHKNGVITGEVTGNIQIEAVATVDQTKVSSFEFNGTYCSCDDIDFMFIGDNFSVTIVPIDDYKLPELGSQNIMISGLEEGYTYNKTNGVVSGVVKDSKVIITCIAEEIIDIVNFVFIGTNCSTTYQNKYDEHTVIELDIEPDFAYELPGINEIITEGLTDISYDPATGKFTATIVADAKLQIAATKITTQHSYTVIAENCEESFSGTAVYGDTVVVTLTPNIGYKLPQKITSSSGCKDISYNPETGELSFVIIGNVSIELSAEYNGREFSFTLIGSHVSCYAPDVLNEGDEFAYSLSADYKYLLPDTVTITGLQNAAYNSSTGEVTGIVIDNVSITCNCVIDPYFFAPLIINCTNCSVNGAPEYIEKGENIYLTVECDDGYMINSYSATIVSGADRVLARENEVLIISNLEDVVEISIVAIVAPKTIDFSGENCTVSFSAGDHVNSVGLAKFNTDEGYILPENISYEGIEVITYNTDTQIMTFRRTAEEASLTVNAVEGEKTYDPTITPDEAKAFLYRNDKIDYTLDTFNNTTLTMVRNIDMFEHDNIDSTNDVLYLKTDYNHMSYETGKNTYYRILNNLYVSLYDGVIYAKDGDGWRLFNPSNSNAPIRCYFMEFIVENPIKSMFIGDRDPIYDETNRCYSTIFDMGPYTLYFKDGLLIGILVDSPNIFVYMEFSDYGTTEITLPEF